MATIDDVKGVIFDYGGTIDSRGVHWSEIIYDGYVHAEVAVDKDDFREAYVYAERELARVRHILPHHNFYDLLFRKMQIELRFLVENRVLADVDVDALAEQIALYCYDHARQCVEEARSTIEWIAQRKPMALVSNFYGNVEAVLADFDLLRYFPKIIESAVVGVRKPDPQIFRLGVEALGLKPEDVLVVGDSLAKDILPAESIGCKTLWLKGKGWTDKEDAVTRAGTIKKLSEVLTASF